MTSTVFALTIQIERRQCYLIWASVRVKFLIRIYSDIRSCKFFESNTFGDSFVSKFSRMSHSETYWGICGGGIFCLQVVTFFQLGGDDDDDDHDADYDDDYDNSDNVLFRLESTGTHPLSLSPSMSLSSAPS